MRRKLCLLLAAALLSPLVAAATGGVAQAATDVPAPVTVHPRLLFSAEDVTDLRQRASEPGTVTAAAWNRLRERAEGLLVSVQPEAVRPGACTPLRLNGLECAYNLQNEMPTYLIDLGMAYQLSGDDRYGRRVIDLLLALGDAGFPYWSGQDLGIGDLLEGIGLGFDWTYPLMTPAQRREIVDDITRYQDLLFVRPLFEYTNEASTYPSSNWMGVTAGGAGLALLAIRGEPGAPSTFTSPPNAAFSNVPAFPQRTYTFQEYLDKALLQVRTYFRGGFDLRGASHEGVTYATYGLKNSVPFALAARREGLGDPMDGTGLPATHSWGGSGSIVLPLTSPGDGTGLRQLSRWLAFEQLPGEGQNFIPLNDSQRTQVGVDLAAQLFAINPDDGVAQWLWRRTVGELGTDYYREPHTPEYLREDKCRYPTELSSTAACDLFNLHGNVWTILWYRSPAQTPEVDPASTGPLSVRYTEGGLVDARTGFAAGREEVVSTFSARPNGIAHFQYDLGSFTLYGQGGRWAIDPGFSCVACGENGDGGFAKQHNVVVIDGNKFTQAVQSRYNSLTRPTVDRFLNAPHASLASADLRYAYNFASPYARRDHLFSRVPGRPVLLGIADQLQRDQGLHSYSWQMLANDDNRVAVDGSGFTLTAPSGAVLAGRVAAAGAMLPVQQRYELIQTPTDDRGKLMPTLYTSTPPQLAMDQMTLMALTPPGSEPARVETLQADGGNAIGVTWKGVQDVVVRRLVGAKQVSGAVETDAAVAKFTRGQGETVLRSGTRLASGDTQYVQVTGGVATVSVSADTVEATGAPGNLYRVYAPQLIRSVIVNGGAELGCRQGDDLVFPCTPTTLTLSVSASASATDPVSLGAALTAAGQPLAGAPVRFAVAGLTVTATTDSAGMAAVVLPMDVDPDDYPLTVTYAGRERYAASTAETTLRVVPDPTVLTYTGQTRGQGSSLQVSAILSDDEGEPLVGKPVTFTNRQRSVVAVTDSSGSAAAVLDVRGHGQSQQLTVTWPGARRFAPTRTQAAITWGGGGP